MTQQEQPPSYDVAVTSEIGSPGPYIPVGSHVADVKDVKAPLPPTEPHDASAGQSSMTVPSMPATTVYNYMNPATGDVVTSLLPPNHPQMVCLQQGHVPHSRYGLLGLLAAVFWFPLGIGLCLLDKRVKCDRCNMIIEEGLCTL